MPPVAVTECPNKSNLRDFRFTLAHGLRVQEGESVSSWSQCVCGQEAEGRMLLFPYLALPMSSFYSIQGSSPFRLTRKSSHLRRHRLVAPLGQADGSSLRAAESPFLSQGHTRGESYTAVPAQGPFQILFLNSVLTTALSCFPVHDGPGFRAQVETLICCASL